MAQDIIEPMFQCTELLEAPYGICSHITRSGERNDYDSYKESLSSLRDVGINIVRTDIDVGSVTPERAPSVTERYDTLFSNMLQSGLSICGILTNIQYNKRSWDDYKTHWRYIDTLLNRYSDYFCCLEMLNEVDRYNDKNAYKKYVRYLKKNYSYIKKRNQNLNTMYGGISWSKAALLNYSSRKKAYKYYDIMNFHVYNLPEKLPSHFNDIRSNMIKYGWRKHVWITECGYSTYGNVSDIIKNEELQGKYLPRTYLISFAFGIDKVFWYCHRSSEINLSEKEDCFGIVHADYSPKPSFYSYQTLIKMCPSNSTRPKLEILNEVYVSKWKRPDNQHVTAIWTIGEEKVIKVPSNIRYKVYNYLGESVSESESINITDGITYIVSDSDIVLDY